MKLLAAVLVAVTVLLSISAKSSGQPLSEATTTKSPSETRTPIKKHWMTQSLDNFNHSDKRTWQMRYFSNDQFYDEFDQSPIFIIIEEPKGRSIDGLMRGLFFDAAKATNAYLFQVQLRFYGEGKTTPDLSVSNLAYLNVNQTLADIANFIFYVKESIPGLFYSKVVVRGSGYAGTLAAWLKRKYPKLVNGVWASGSPLLAKVDLREYTEIIGENIRFFGSQECYNRIESGINKLQQIIESEQSFDIKSRLNLDDNFERQNDIDVGSLFSGNLNFFLTNISKTCKSIMDEDDDLTGITKTLFPKSSERQENLKTLRNTSYVDWSRQWFYQCCNELGWFPTSESIKQPFGSKFQLGFYVKLCADLFGANYTISRIQENINNTNKYFRGRDLGLTHSYFTQGELDPMRSIQKLDEVGVTIFSNHSLVNDFYSMDEADFPELRASKVKVLELIKKWIRFEYNGYEFH